MLGIRRREFITVVGSAPAWPFAGCAEAAVPGDRVRRRSGS
jgi:hypothetical protein